MANASFKRPDDSIIDMIKRSGSMDTNTRETAQAESFEAVRVNYEDDYVLLEDLDLSIHLVKESEVISKDSRSHAKFIHGIKLLMAKNYIDNLSEEVKKGMREKAEQGHFPGKAPLGPFYEIETSSE